MGVLPPEKKRKHVESAEDDEEIRSRRDGGFTCKQEGENSPLFLYSRKLLWDNVLQKIEAKKENLRKRSRFGWENTAAEHESLWAAGFWPDNKQTEFMANCDRMMIFANCLHIWENIISCEGWTNLLPFGESIWQHVTGNGNKRKGIAWGRQSVTLKSLCVFF